jgi:effector-binding domain-containing protein
MKFAETKYDNSQTGCCALIDPADWDEKEFAFEEKRFVKDHVRSFLHMPLNFGKVIGKMHEKVEEQEGYAEMPIVLSDEVSVWGSDLYMAVEKEIEGLENVTLSGTFLTKVFEGPYSRVRAWIGEMNEYVEAQGKKVKKMYFYYTVCPKCGKTFGKNYIVIFAQVEE